MPLPTFARNHLPPASRLRIERESQTIATMNAPAERDPPGGSARDSSSDSDFPPPALARSYGDAMATDLPRGVPGSATASEVAFALVRAFALRLPDLTGSAPELFTALVDHGLLPSLPSARVMPAALALLASVSPLVEQRSARRWTIWFTRARDPAGPLADVIRRRASVPTVASAPTPTRRPRSSTIRAEREALARALADAEAEQAQQSAALHDAERARDALVAELAAAREELGQTRQREEDLRQHLEREQTRASTLQAQLERALHTTEDSEATRRALEAQLTADRERHQALQQEHDEALEQLATATRDRDDARATLETRTSQCDQLVRLIAAHVDAGALPRTVKEAGDLLGHHKQRHTAALADLGRTRDALDAMTRARDSKAVELTEQRALRDKRFERIAAHVSADKPPTDLEHAEDLLAMQKQRLDAAIKDLDAAREALDEVTRSRDDYAAGAARLIELRDNLFARIAEHVGTFTSPDSLETAEELLASHKRRTDTASETLQVSHRALTDKLAEAEKQREWQSKLSEVRLGNANVAAENALERLKAKNEEIETLKRQIEQLQDAEETRENRLRDQRQRFNKLWLVFVRLQAEIELRRERHPTDSALERAIDEKLVEYAKNPPNPPV